MNNVKSLPTYEVLFFPIFQKSGGIEKYKKICPPPEIVEITPLVGPILIIF